jgi:hypothetical protein
MAARPGPELARSARRRTTTRARSSPRPRRGRRSPGALLEQAIAALQRPLIGAVLAQYTEAVERPRSRRVRRSSGRPSPPPGHGGESHAHPRISPPAWRPSSVGEGLPDGLHRHRDAPRRPGRLNRPPTSPGWRRTDQLGDGWPGSRGVQGKYSASGVGLALPLLPTTTVARGDGWIDAAWRFRKSTAWSVSRSTTRAWA